MSANYEPESIARNQPQVSVTPGFSSSPEDPPGPLETSNLSVQSKHPRSLSQLLVDNRQRPDDSVPKIESNADQDEEAHPVEIPPLTIRTSPEPADRSPDGGHNYVAVETSDPSQAKSEENVDITDRATVLPLMTVEIASFRHQLNDLRSEVEQMHDEIDSIENINIPEALDRAVEQAVPLAATPAANDVAEQIPTANLSQQQSAISSMKNQCKKR